MSNDAVNSARAEEGAPDPFIEIGLRARAYSHRFEPSRALLDTTFGPHNPWFHSQEGALFWGEETRLATFAPTGLHIDGAQAGFFGYFESSCEPGSGEEVKKMLAHAARWGAARGLERTYGPVDFSTHGMYRLKTGEEQGALPFLGEPHTPLRYAPLLTSAGAEVVGRYVTQIFSTDEIASKHARKRSVRDRLVRQGWRFLALTPSFWLAHLSCLHILSESIFGENFAYTPISYEAFERACGERFIALFDPMTSVVALDPQGEIAGLFLVQPHYGALFDGPGALDPQARSFEQDWPSIERAAMTPTAIMKTVGVRRDRRGLGVMDALTVEVFDRGVTRYSRWFGALIRDDNPSRRFAHDAHSTQRDYALFSIKSEE